MNSNAIKSVAAALAVIILLAPATVLADIIILKSGDQVTGRFANRELLRKDPFALKHVAIDVGGSGAPDMQTYPFDQVRYLVFVGAQGERDVLDLSAAHVGTRAIPRPTPRAGTYPAAAPTRTQYQSPATGVGLMLLGTGAILFGTLHKFGGEERYTTGFGTFVQTRKEYNAGNWILIGAGSFLVLTGVYVLTTRSAMEPPPDRPIFGMVGGDGTVTVGVRLGL